MKTYTLEELTDEFVGEKGTFERNQFDSELNGELVSYAIKQVRLKRKLTQSQLGELVGVQKSQISKLESNLSNAKLETILKVFKALNAKINFQVELLDQTIELA